MLLKRQSIAEIPAVGRAELHKKSVALALQQKEDQEILEKLRLGAS
jgi:hypothetical protein